MRPTLCQRCRHRSNPNGAAHAGCLQRAWNSRIVCVVVISDSCEQGTTRLTTCGNSMHVVACRQRKGARGLTRTEGAGLETAWALALTCSARLGLWRKEPPRERRSAAERSESRAGDACGERLARFLRLQNSELFPPTQVSEHNTDVRRITGLSTGPTVATTSTTRSSARGLFAKEACSQSHSAS